MTHTISPLAALITANQRQGSLLERMERNRARQVILSAKISEWEARGEDTLRLRDRLHVLAAMGRLLYAEFCKIGREWPKHELE